MNRRQEEGKDHCANGLLPPFPPSPVDYGHKLIEWRHWLHLIFKHVATVTSPFFFHLECPMPQLVPCDGQGAQRLESSCLPPLLPSCHYPYFFNRSSDIPGKSPRANASSPNHGGRGEIIQGNVLSPCGHSLSPPVAQKESHGILHSPEKEEEVTVAQAVRGRLASSSYWLTNVRKTKGFKWLQMASQGGETPADV